MNTPMHHHQPTLRRAVTDIQALEHRFALVGGLAVAARTQTSAIRTVSLALSVRDDAEAESLVHSLQNLGYQILGVIEQTHCGRLASVPLAPPRADEHALILLLFAASGIEPEIVRAAEPLPVFDAWTIPVACVGHLLVLKVLSRDDDKRPQDRVHLQSLMQIASQHDIVVAREAAALIAERGFARGRNLTSLLDATCREFRPDMG